MKTVVCPYCGFGCKLIIDEESGKVRPYTGEPNRGKLCPKGLYALEFVTSGRRLKRPLKRVGSAMVPVSWGVAIGEIANRLLEMRELYGPDSVMFLASSKISNEENYLLQKIARLFGTNNIDNCARLCHEASVHALKLTVGTGAQTNPYSDLEDFKVILIWGYNPAETHPVVMDYVLKAKRKGASIITVDVRKSRTMSFADYKLVIKPGTDIVLANAMANVIIGEGLYDEEFVRTRTTGFSELRMGTMKYTPEYAEKVTGIPAETIREVARTFALAGSGAIMWGMGLTQHVSGVENVLALINLALLLGYIGERGGLYPMRGQNNVQGAAYMGALSEFLPGYVPLSDERFRKRVADVWGVDDLPTERGLYLTELWEAIERGDIRALYIVGENPAASEANLSEIRRALKKLDLLVVQDLFMTRTARYAHYVLPASSFCEKSGSYMNSERRIQWSQGICKPVGDSKPDWEILTMLGRALGLPGFSYATVEKITEEYFKLFPELEERSAEELKRGDIFLPRRRLHTWEFATPDGKARFMAVERIAPWEEPDDEYPYVMVTVRLIGHYNTGEMTRRSPSLVRLMKEPRLEINGDDAEKLGVKTGDTVEVRSRRGRVRMKVKVSDNVPRGLVIVPFHFKANELTSQALNRAGTPEFKYSAVALRKV